MTLASWLKTLWSGRVARRIAAKPASGFIKLKPAQLEKLGYSRKAERYVETGARLTKKTPTISKRQFRVKETGLAPEKLAQEHKAGTRAYKTAASEEQAGKQIATRGRLKLVREARREYELHGSAMVAAIHAARGTIGPSARHRPRRVWTGLSDQIDQAIGPDTGEVVASRELGGRGTRIEDGNWHQLIDAIKDREGESSPIVKLLRSSGRFVEGGIWVTD